MNTDSFQLSDPRDIMVAAKYTRLEPREGGGIVIVGEFGGERVEIGAEIPKPVAFATASGVGYDDGFDSYVRCLRAARIAVVRQLVALGAA
jgi:hypothetical protein